MIRLSQKLFQKLYTVKSVNLNNLNKQQYHVISSLALQNNNGQQQQQPIQQDFSRILLQPKLVNFQKQQSFSAKKTVKKTKKSTKKSKKSKVSQDKHIELKQKVLKNINLEALDELEHNQDNMEQNMMGMEGLEEDFQELEELKREYDLIDACEYDCDSYQFLTQHEIESGGESELSEEIDRNDGSDLQITGKQLKKKKTKKTKSSSGNMEATSSERNSLFKQSSSDEKNVKNLMRFVDKAQELMSSSAINKLLLLIELYKSRVSTNTFTHHINVYENNLIISVGKIFKKENAEELSKYFLRCSLNNLTRELFQNRSVQDIDKAQELKRKQEIYKNLQKESIPIAHSQVNELENLIPTNNQKKENHFNYGFQEYNTKNKFEILHEKEEQENQMLLKRADEKVRGVKNDIQEFHEDAHDLIINDTHELMHTEKNVDRKINTLISKDKQQSDKFDNIYTQTMLEEDEADHENPELAKQNELQNNNDNNNNAENEMQKIIFKETENPYNINFTDMIGKRNEKQIDQIHKRKSHIQRKENFQTQEEDFILYQQNFNLRYIKKTNKVYSFGYTYDTTQAEDLEGQIKEAVEVHFGPIKSIKVYNYRDFMTGYGDSLEKRQEKVLQVNEEDLEQSIQKGKKIKKSTMEKSPEEFKGLDYNREERKSLNMMRKLEDSKAKQFNKSYVILELDTLARKKDILGDDMRAFGMRIGTTNSIKFEDADYKTSILVRNLPYGIQIKDFIEFYNELCENMEQTSMKLDIKGQMQNKVITKDYIILRFKSFEESEKAINLLHKIKFEKQVLRSQHFYGNLIPEDHYDQVKEELIEFDEDDHILEYRENFERPGSDFLMRKIKDQRDIVYKELNKQQTVFEHHSDLENSYQIQQQQNQNHSVQEYHQQNNQVTQFSNINHKFDEQNSDSDLHSQSQYDELVYEPEEYTMFDGKNEMQFNNEFNFESSDHENYEDEDSKQLGSEEKQYIDKEEF